MKKNKIGSAYVLTLFIGLLSVSCAFGAESGAVGVNVFYVGGGSDRGGDANIADNKSPYALGFLRLSNSSNIVWGLDLSKEGSMLDSTWGQRNKIKQATSLNFILGGNMGRTANSRFDGAVLLGGRESTASCPASYLGYQCYADSSPNVSYKFNYGVLATWSYKELTVGVRATGESTQALFGVRF